jgi:transposase
VAVPELIVDRDRLIGLVRDGNSPEQIARTFRVEVRIVQDMIRRLEENGYYDLLREKG